MSFVPPAPYPMRLSPLMDPDAEALRRFRIGLTRRHIRARKKLEQENAALRGPQAPAVDRLPWRRREARHARWKRAMVKLYGWAPTEPEIRAEADRVLALYTERRRG